MALRVSPVGRGSSVLFFRYFFGLVVSIACFLAWCALYIVRRLDGTLCAVPWLLGSTGGGHTIDLSLQPIDPFSSVLYSNMHFSLVPSKLDPKQECAVLSGI